MSPRGPRRRTGVEQAALALTWVTDDAVCRQNDPELWFSDEGTVDTEAAKALCRSCPLLETCLAYATSDHRLEGTWGATTYGERHGGRRPDGGTAPRGTLKPRWTPAQDDELVNGDGTLATRAARIGRSFKASQQRYYRLTAASAGDAPAT